MRRVNVHRGVVEMTVKVFLLDDHELVRRGIVDLLSGYDDLEVVGEASTGEEAMRRIAVSPPDVALLDVRLGDPERSGIEICRDLRSEHPDVVCLMLTSYSDDDALVASVLAGASGYLLKQIRGPELVDSIRRAAGGASLLEGDVVAKVLERLRAPVDDPLDALSGQERRILDLIAEGLTNRQIGEQLFLAEKTVKNYVSNVLAKLGMSRRTEAAAFRARLDERERLETKPWS
jgi:DNA-binding NarL/FixJ family response regulator